MSHAPSHGCLLARRRSRRPLRLAGGKVAGRTAGPGAGGRRRGAGPGGPVVGGHHRDTKTQTASGRRRSAASVMLEGSGHAGPARARQPCGAGTPRRSIGPHRRSGPVQLRRPAGGSLHDHRVEVRVRGQHLRRQTRRPARHAGPTGRGPGARSRSRFAAARQRHDRRRRGRTWRAVGRARRCGRCGT